MIALPAVFVRRPWGLVVVRGPDATSFLQSIVSQDLDPVGVGETVPSLLLHPQGKLDVAFRATLRDRDDGGGSGGDEWWLDTEPQMAEQLANGLGRFKIRVDAEIDDRTGATACASVIQPETPPSGVVLYRIHGVITDTTWGPRDGIDLVGSAAAVDAFVDECDLRRGTDEELEVLRIESGIPKQGVDVDETTIPQEAFLEEDAVSFTKGCFIGQELVCRIDSRGHVNRFLRRLEIPGTHVPAPGAEVTVDGKAVGAITSAAAVPGEDRVVALAMVRREVEPPIPVTIASTPATLLP